MWDRHVAKGLAKSQACSKSRAEEFETNFAMFELERSLDECAATSSHPFSREIRRHE